MIAQEAGAFVTGSKDAPHDGVVTEAILTGRRYLVIRGVGNAVRARVPQYSTEIMTRADSYYAITCYCTVSIHPFTSSNSYRGRRRAVSTCRSA